MPHVTQHDVVIARAPSLSDRPPHPIICAIAPTGVPVASYKLSTSWIKPGAIVVNVSSFKNVDEEELLKVGRHRTPVPTRAHR